MGIALLSTLSITMHALHVILLWRGHQEGRIGRTRNLRNFQMKNLVGKENYIKLAKRDYTSEVSSSELGQDF
jgi:hypothetical protein